MFIRTERLFLRPTFPEDWRAIYRGIADEGTVRMLARAPWPYTEDNAREYCNRVRGPEHMGFAIVLPGAPDAPLIGQIGLEPQGKVAMEVGYWIARDHRGHGYAREALEGVLGTARALGIGRVEAGHFIDNPASGTVLRKCGFEPTGKIELTVSAGRGGEAVPARRYAISLAAALPAAA